MTRRLAAPRGRARACTAVVLLVAALAACSTAPPRSAGGRAASKPAARAQDGAPAVPLPTNPRGGYYGDDGPPDAVPPGLDLTPDAVPRAEPLSPRANRPYVVFGRAYQPMTRHAPYRERGAASWYGRKFHGQTTSNGEVYDMFGMSAAHPTLPLPSYARVTNLRNGRSVVVRVNDRGPFLNDRLIDLSYAAALKLGYAQGGSTEVEVELILPEEAPSYRIMQASLEGAVQPLPAVEARPPRPLPPPSPPSPLSSSPPAASAVGPSPAVPASGPASLPPARTSRRADQAAGPTGLASPAEPAGEATAAPAADEPTRLILETLPAPADDRPPPGSSALPAPPAPAAMSAAPPALPAPSRPVAPSAVGYAQAFVQLGAFASRGNADAARYRLADAIDPPGAPIAVIEERGLFKVLAGPLPARDASALADRVRQATGSRPFVVVR